MTAQEATATRLRVEDLRRAATENAAQLRALPAASGTSIAGALATFHQADADMEDAEARIRQRTRRRAYALLSGQLLSQPREVELAVHQEVLLLRPHRGVHPRHALVGAEDPEDPERLLREAAHSPKDQRSGDSQSHNLPNLRR